MSRNTFFHFSCFLLSSIQNHRKETFDPHHVGTLSRCQRIECHGEWRVSGMTSEFTGYFMLLYCFNLQTHCEVHAWNKRIHELKVENCLHKLRSALLVHCSFSEIARSSTQGSEAFDFQFWKWKEICQSASISRSLRVRTVVIFSQFKKKLWKLIMEHGRFVENVNWEC